MNATETYNQSVKSNLELLSKIKNHLKWGEHPENINWANVGDQDYVNQKLQEISRFIDLSLADKEQD